jgi:hypothetical protein
LLLRALLREPTPRRPIWLMRQAGRYLPEYRATRKRAGNFLAMCTNPEIACEVTLQPVDRYPLDAAILFSDILTIPHAMNLGLEFEAGEGPTFAAAGAHRGRHRSIADSGSRPRIEVRRRCRGADPPRIGGPRAVDRIRGQSVDRRDLHGGGRRQQDLRADQAHDVRGAASAASAARLLARATCCI